MKLRFLTTLFVLLAMPLAGAAPSPPPADSIYRLPVALTDQNGHGFHLADRQGKPQIVSMFYTSCQYVCPLIIDTLKRTHQALAPDVRTAVQLLLVSFDPERDTPKRLQQVYAERKLDAATWTLARTEPAGVRQLAAVLDIQYRALANREINHSSALVLLDAQGRIVARTDKIGEVDPDFVSAVQKALREH